MKGPRYNPEEHSAEVRAIIDQVDRQLEIVNRDSGTTPPTAMPNVREATAEEKIEVVRDLTEGWFS